MSKLDAYILDYMVTHGCVNEFKSIRIHDLEVFTVTFRTVSNRLKSLVKRGYIACGMMDARAKTYYITQDGLKYYKEVISDDGGI